MNILTCSNYSFNSNNYCLYTLKLQKQKRYTGITTDVFNRIYEHRNNTGKGAAEWVKLHSPVIEVEEIINLNTTNKKKALQCERFKTIQLMNKYGVKNVRGWHITTPDLETAYKLIDTYNIRNYLTKLPYNHDFFTQGNYTKRTMSNENNAKN